MPRSINAVSSRGRRKKLLKEVKGFRGARSKLIRTASDALDRAGVHAYVGRKQKKREYRRLWTVRINNACRLQDLSYSRFIHGLKVLNINLNRKVLAELAVNDEVAFTQLIEKVKAIKV